MRFLPLSLLTVTLFACNHDSNKVETAAAEFSLTCDMSEVFTPAATAVETIAAESNNTTVIILHGKSGSPNATHLVSLGNDLNNLGYDVVAPYMPWSSSNWNGTLCQGASYVNALINTEKDKGNKVILLGHSLGGPNALAYAALENSAKPDAVVALAPGHFVHRSSLLQAGHKTSIETANSMINNGQSNDIATFTTVNGGVDTYISTTPKIYLSFHSTSEFPDIATSTASVKQPLLWLAGADDNLTGVADKFGLTSYIPDSPSNKYKVIPGGHISLVDSVATELDSWFQAL